MSETEYATKDGRLWATLTTPEGLIPPPTIDLHRPEAGGVTFYLASAFGIRKQGDVHE